MSNMINTNLASMTAQNSLSKSQSSLSTSLQRLSSGMRINSAKDDAAGLAIATKMDSQIRGMAQSGRNANDGISLSQTADGALATASDALQRMRELAVQGASGTLGSDDAANMDKEYQALAKEVTRISTDTKFNGISVLDAAGRTGGTDIQVGADVGQTINIPETDLKAQAATLDGATDVTDVAKSNAAITALDLALQEVTGQRADLGAAQNRLGFAATSLQNSVENQTAAKSRIMDADFATETANLSRGQILQQAGTAMLAQANSLPNGVMALLR